MLAVDDSHWSEKPAEAHIQRIGEQEIQVGLFNGQLSIIARSGDKGVFYLGFGMKSDPIVKIIAQVKDEAMNVHFGRSVASPMFACISP